MSNKLHVEDLILKVDKRQSIDDQLDLYEPFFDSLFDEEYYFLKQAAREALSYLLNGKYENLETLAAENFSSNERLQEKYLNLSSFKNKLQLGDKKVCTLDLATGTGKSFLIYAIAQVALSLKLVEKVLVLCPSTTIEDGLRDKFTAFAGNAELLETLPDNARVIPRIVDANQTVMNYDICVENIHAVYENTNSSIKDSFSSSGSRTLILNDEAHHIYNKVTGTDVGSIKKWKSFLANSLFNFKYIVNVTGTPYIEDEYFTDVIYRYSIFNAISEKIVKIPNYLIEIGSEKRMSDFQEIYQNHQENIKEYDEVKPISIVITSDIKTCVEVYEELVKYVSKKEKISEEESRKRCIWVASQTPDGGSEKDRLENLRLLKTVDESSNPVEWIISVAMLTEGWDVKNVFQIVPHDSRAFNSKLLIAQVLGRGLRIPKVYINSNKDIKVRIYNHIRFSQEIKSLFDDVLDLDDKISLSVDTSSKYNFILQNMNYKKEEQGTPQSRKPTEKFSKVIELLPQEKKTNDFGIYQNAVSGSTEEITYNLDNRFLGLDEAVKTIFSHIKSMDLELGRDFGSQYPESSIKELIVQNLKNSSDDFLSEENVMRVKRAISKLYDIGGDTVIYKDIPESIYEVSTKNIAKSLVGTSIFRNNKTRKLFYTSSLARSLPPQELSLFEKMLEESDIYEIEEVALFKSPQMAINANHSPEKKFLTHLISGTHSQHYDSFIKSPDKGFYSVPYSYKKGTHMKYGSFNPDFFIMKSRQVIVVEIKDDNEDSRETQAKMRDALAHFAELNSRQSTQQYIFLILGKSDFELFFNQLDRGNLIQYQSEIMDRLKLLLQDN